MTGAALGVIFGLPSLRLRGLYLAVSTLALHFIVIYLGHEYETQARLLHRHPDRSARRRRLRASMMRASGTVVLLAAAAGSVLFALNLLRTRTGRAWRAIHDHETVAAALGINVPRTSSRRSSSVRP